MERGQGEEVEEAMKLLCSVGNLRVSERTLTNSERT